MENELKTTKNEVEECDECITRGICSVSPGLSSLHTVILIYLKELSFYLLKLKELGGTNTEIKKTVMAAFAGILANAEYNQTQFHKIIAQLNEDIEQTKIIYNNYCTSHQIKPQILKTYFKHNKNLNIADATKKGEKYSQKKNERLTDIQRNFFDIMIFLIKSMCLKILELERLGKENDENYYAILSFLNNMNMDTFSTEKLKEEINKFVKSYYNTIIEVFYAQNKAFGETMQNEVSFSTKPGKAILVSGSDYKKLESVLKATENTEISVYTHGSEMLFAHTRSELKNHPNLKGHFGHGVDISLIDFAEFPGPILMTKLTLHSSMALYRGRLFTLDPIAPQGIIKIEGNNYKPLIDSALKAPGFVHGREKPSMLVGYDEKDIIKKADEIMEKINKGLIKHLYIIGTYNLPNCCPKYFETFLKILPKNCYAFSLSCKEKGENIFHLDSLFDHSLLYKLLKRIDEIKPIKDINISLFVTKCDKHTIANLIHLKQIGIKNVYMCKCPSSLINPTIIKTMQEVYGIKEFSNPKADLQETLKEINKKRGE